jgi:hypothetical protein
MPRIIEHGAGAAAGAQAFGAALGGVVSGVQIASELQQREAAIRQKRLQTQLLGQEAELVQQHRQAQEEWDVLQAALGAPGAGPRNINEVPLLRDADTGATEAPGVLAAPSGLTREQARIFPSLSPESRALVLEEIEQDRQAKHFTAIATNLRGRAAMMGSGSGPYTPPGGTEGGLPPQLQAFADQAEQVAEAFDLGLLTGKEANSEMNRISDGILEAKWATEEEILAASALFGALDAARDEVGVMGFDNGKIEYIEGIIKQWTSGILPAPIARLLVGLGPKSSDELISWVLEKNHEAGGGGRSYEAQNRLNITGVPGRESPRAPGGRAQGQGGADDGLSQEAATDEVGGSAVAAPGSLQEISAEQQGTAPSQDPGAGFVTREETELYDERYKPSAALVVREKATAHQMDLVIDLGRAFSDGDGQAIKRLLDTAAKNDRDRTIFADLGAEMSEWFRTTPESHQKKKIALGADSRRGVRRGKITNAQAVAGSRLKKAYEKQAAIIKKGPADVGTLLGAYGPPGEESGLEGQATRRPSEGDPSSQGEWGLGHFDPEGSGYDDETAAKAGMQRGPSGHMSSREAKTGLLLKGRKHDTWDLLMEGEVVMGHQVYKHTATGRYYSFPADDLIEVARHEGMLEPISMKAAEKRVADKAPGPGEELGLEGQVARVPAKGERATVASPKKKKTKKKAKKKAKKKTKKKTRAEELRGGRGTGPSEYWDLRAEQEARKKAKKKKKD